MSRKIFLALHLYFVIFPTIYAMESPSILYDQKIKYIRIESDFPVARQEIIRALTISDGDVLTPESIRSSLKNLFLLEQYRQVEVETRPFLDGVNVIFKITPEWIVRKIRLKGQKTGYFFAYGFESRISKRDITRALKLKENEVFTIRKLSDSIKSLEELYFKYGYAQCKIKPDIRYNYENRFLDVIFDVDKGNPPVITKISFNGNKAFKSEELLTRIKLNLGRRFIESQLAADQQRLHEFYLKKGYYTVRIFRPEAAFDKDANSISIEYKIEEGERYRIRVDAPTHWWNFSWKLHRFEPKPLTLLETLGFSEVDDITLENLESAGSSLEKHFKEHGYANAKAKFTLNRNPEGFKEITYIIPSTQKVRISHFQIIGNQAVHEDELKELLRSAPGRLFTQDAFMQDCEAIRKIYRQKGFPNVELKESAEYLNPSAKEVLLKVELSEKSQIKIHDLQLTGGNAFTEREILEKLELQMGAPYNQVKIDEQISILLNAYHQKGYAEVVITHEVIPSSDSPDVDIKIRIEEGRISLIQRVLVKGLKKTQPALIRKKIENLESQPFNMESLISAQHSISKLGLFTSVRLTTPPSELNSEFRTILFTVQERPSLFLETGPGYNTDAGFSGYLQLFTTNLYGTNRYLGGSVFLSQHSEKSQIVYREPEFAGSPIQMELRFIRNLTEEDGYKLFIYGGRMSWTYRWRDKVRGILEYRLDEDRPYDIDDEVNLPEKYRESLRIGSLSPVFLYDSRDDVRDSHSGNLISFKTEFARTVFMSEADFTKITFDLTHFQPISSTQVLAVSFRSGWARELPFPERFKLGGIKTIRGWRFEDIYVETSDELLPPSGKSLHRGGDIMLLFNCEYRIPMLWGLQGVTFFDAGNVWDSTKDIQIDNLKGSAGLGLRFMTPIGPVGLDYAYNVMRDEDDPRERWSFVIGHAF